MDMKPEYNYGRIGDEKYKLSLMIQSVGDNWDDLREIIAPLNPTVARWTDNLIAYILQDRPNYPYELLGQEFSSYADCEAIANKILSTGAKPEIVDISEYHVINPDALITYVQEENNSATSDELLLASEHLSRELVDLREYALDKWAIANETQEAYRFTMNPLNYVRNERCYRIWKSKNQCFAVSKQMALLELKIQDFIIAQARWLSLVKFLKNIFWTSNTWRTIIPPQCLYNRWYKILL